MGKIRARCARCSGDLAARRGGEKLVLLLHDSAYEAVATIAEEIRSALTARGIDHGGSDVDTIYTASFDVAAAVPGDSCSPRMLVDAADEALCDARARGRNPVEIAG